MKYQCEICGCTSDNIEVMKDHEKQCWAKHENLIYCKENLNVLINLANTFTFGIDVEIPGEKENELKYYKITTAELDGKKNRCILKVKNEESQLPAESKKSTKKQS